MYTTASQNQASILLLLRPSPPFPLRHRAILLPLLFDKVPQQHLQPLVPSCEKKHIICVYL